MVKSYDQSSYDIAEAFLSDSGFIDPKLTHELALEVQQTIEDFLNHLETEREAQQSQPQPSQP